MRTLTAGLPALILISTCVAPLLGACGGSDGASADGAPGADSGGGGDATGGADARVGDDDPYRTDLVGRVNLTEYVGGGGGVFAYFANGPDLPPEVEIARAGDCAVYEHAQPTLCEGTCDGFCHEGTCLPTAPWLDAGTVTVGGIATPVTLTQTEANFYAADSDADMFSAGDLITVAATGAAFPAFELAANGVADMTDVPGLIALEGAEAYTFTWTPAAAPGRIQLALRIGWHGAPWESMLLCETDDDGSLEIPGTLVGQFPDFGGVGLFQWPSELQRFSRTVLETTQGPIELFVGSRQVVSFTHE